MRSEKPLMVLPAWKKSFASLPATCSNERSILNQREDLPKERPPLPSPLLPTRRGRRRMNSFRYQAMEGSGAAVKGVIGAKGRKCALLLLGERGLFPSILEVDAPAAKSAGEAAEAHPAPGFRFGKGVKRKEITAFTREMGALLSAGIPIPQALAGLGEEEENPALKRIVLEIGEAVRKGMALSTAVDEHSRLFSKLYVSMVRVGEEAGVLPKVMNDLAALLEHEDEIRSEVAAAVAYPLFVLGFGVFTVIFLLTVVMPKLASMLQDMLPTLPLPTLI